jgi:hypothetical protein
MNSPGIASRRAWRVAIMLCAAVRNCSIIPSDLAAIVLAPKSTSLSSAMAVLPTSSHLPQHALDVDDTQRRNALLLLQSLSENTGGERRQKR